MYLSSVLVAEMNSISADHRIAVYYRLALAFKGLVTNKLSAIKLLS